MPAGYIASNDDSLLIKVGDQFASLEEVENLLLMSMDIDGLEESPAEGSGQRPDR